MKSIYLLLLGLFFGQAASAQQIIQIKNGCAWDEDPEHGDVYAFDPSDEADRIVTEILQVISLPKNFLIKACSVKNAQATTDGGQRFILYSTSFLERFQGDDNTRWAAYSILAHELGHHLSGHNFAEKDPRRRKLMELEADRFSGGVLRLLGANLLQAQAGIESLESEAESATHPPKIARREAVASEWKRKDEWMKANGMVARPPARTHKEPAPVSPSLPPRCSYCPEMVLVEGGSFIMGCDNCDENDKPAHRVTLPNYYIGKYEVTQAEYAAVMETNPSAHQNCDRCPVEQVSWDDAQEYIAKLNQKTGRRYRLLSEAEWEYAARGGRYSKGYKYAGSDVEDDVAWTNKNSNNLTQRVGTKKANELGIYDMSGNIFEWCQDKWHNNYEGAPRDGSPWDGSMDNGSEQVVCRGGCFTCGYATRTTEHESMGADGRNDFIGFRLAMDAQ